MCVEICIMPEGSDQYETYGTPNELAPVMPNGLVFTEPGYLDRPPTATGMEVGDCCLCWLDVDATAEANGYTAEDDESYMFVVFTRKGEP